MFYFLLPSLVSISYDIILIIAAIIPAVFLMIKVYKSDRLEKESPYMLWGLVRAGVLSSLIALVSERILTFILGKTVQNRELYDIILYFVIVALSEEGAKYYMLNRYTWKSREFNCQYDGLVYAVFISLGFALWENISYVLHYGFSTALVRAVTAIPGHTCFAVFMGVFYGLARKSENEGLLSEAARFKVLSVVIPALLHGAYDYIASTKTSAWYFVSFISVLFAVSFILTIKMSRRDRFI